ncbi:MAG: hypothetical protein ACOCTQ_00325, partial [Planctomycetota bacterium]
MNRRIITAAIIAAPVLLLSLSIGWGLPADWKLQYLLPEKQNREAVLEEIASDTQELMGEKDTIRIANDLEKVRSGLSRG